MNFYKNYYVFAWGIIFSAFHEQRHGSLISDEIWQKLESNAYPRHVKKLAAISYLKAYYADKEKTRKIISYIQANFPNQYPLEFTEEYPEKTFVKIKGKPSLFNKETKFWQQVEKNPE